MNVRLFSDFTGKLAKRKCGGFGSLQCLALETEPHNSHWLNARRPIVWDGEPMLRTEDLKCWKRFGILSLRWLVGVVGVCGAGCLLCTHTHYSGGFPRDQVLFLFPKIRKNHTMSTMSWKHDGNVIVVTGGWNANILLNTEWLKRYLFTDQEEFKVEVQLAPIPSPPRILTSQMRISLSGQRLCFAPRSDSFEQLEAIEEALIRVVDFLPHTPVNALGVNFQFEFAPEAALRVCRSRTIDGALTTLGDIREELYRFTLVTNQRGEVNILLRQPSTGCATCELNFHHALNSIADIKEVFTTSHVVKYKERAEEMSQALANTLTEEVA